MTSVDAKIMDAKILKVLDIFKKHKPRGVHLTDTEAIVLTLQTRGGEKLSETLYGCILPDGRINTKEISKGAGARQRRMAHFISKYISKDVANYNVKENIGKWKGKSVTLEKEGGYLFLA